MYFFSTFRPVRSDPKSRSLTVSGEELQLKRKSWIRSALAVSFSVIAPLPASLSVELAGDGVGAAKIRPPK